MSQMNKTIRPLRVAMTRRPHLIETRLSRKAITFHLHLKERLLLLPIGERNELGQRRLGT